MFLLMSKSTTIISFIYTVAIISYVHKHLIKTCYAVGFTYMYVKYKYVHRILSYKYYCNVRF